MTALNFFLNLIALCGTYINSFVDVIFSTSSLYIPFCILFGCGCIGIVYKFVKG